ncbi:hypothetical protein AD945_04005 [Gluconobacter albidus]|uniref:Helix-turn-helix domain-containing protein n=2 Tax=Gluconobacter albidus TaxID=318683 RepID=A0A149TLG9_9PROT|nr:hypothetical protein AD945_04005 [Gluconobacter albidus]
MLFEILIHQTKSIATALRGADYGEQTMHILNNFPEYASIPLITQRFNISRSGIYRMLSQGDIQAVKVGRSTRIVARSVEAYFARLPRLGVAA